MCVSVARQSTALTFHDPCDQLIRRGSSHTFLPIFYLADATALASVILKMSSNGQIPDVSSCLDFVLRDLETTSGPPYPSWYDGALVPIPIIISPLNRFHLSCRARRDPSEQEPIAIA